MDVLTSAALLLDQQLICFVVVIAVSENLLLFVTEPSCQLWFAVKNKVHVSGIIQSCTLWSKHLEAITILKVYS